PAAAHAAFAGVPAAASGILDRYSAPFPALAETCLYISAASRPPARVPAAGVPCDAAAAFPAALRWQASAQTLARLAQAPTDPKWRISSPQPPTTHYLLPNTTTDC